MSSTYHVTTFGCQMNAHDSERIRGMLEALDYVPAGAEDDADVVVFNTCTIREKPDQRMFHLLDHVKGRKARNPQLVVAVGGCLVEAQRDALLTQFPWVDVAFGPGRIAALGDFLRARRGEGVSTGITPEGMGFYGIGDERQFAAELPAHRERAAQAWVQISMGCNMKCSYCIVPSVRGREVSRPLAEIVSEVEQLAADGVREVTLLGQNVNSYGRSLPVAERATFAELLRAVDEVDGLERIRFTSPHPSDMREDVIAAMAECHAVMPQLHLPLQSGSSRVLKAMRRTYSREKYLELAAKIRSAVPDMAFSTDIIVGFPGETEADFEQTMEVCREMRYDGAFTFAFSVRSGTEAAGMDDMPQETKIERLERLIEVVRACALERNEARIGQTFPVLVEGASRRDPDMLHGRTPHNVKINFRADAAPGEFVDVRVVQASSESLRGEVHIAGLGL